VRADIETIDGFSAHGDYNEILRWLRGFKTAPDATFLVHGEPRAIESMKGRIEERHKGWKVVAPEYLDKVEL
jgi:metallo-beta-lactamase family protein